MAFLYRSINGGYLRIGSTIAQLQFSVTQQLAKGLNLQSFLTYTPNFWSAKQWRTPQSPYYRYDLETNTFDLVTRSLDEKASLYQCKSQGDNYNYVGQLNYWNTFYNDHTISLTAVVDFTKGNTDRFEAAKKNYILNIDELNMGSADRNDWTMLNGNSSDFRWLGFVGKAAYNYKQRYYADFSCRYDGHYYFAPGHRFGFFPAGSVAWRASEEEFLKSHSHWLNNLKLRASYGLSGNLASSPFQYMSSYTYRAIAGVLDGKPYPGLQETLEPNPRITWETAKKFDIGVDMTLWNGLLDITADWFYEIRSNMLVTPTSTVSAEYGIGLTQINDGIMHNKGIEFSLGSQYKLNKDWTFSFKGDFTWAQNKTVKIYIAVR